MARSSRSTRSTPAPVAAAQYDQRANGALFSRSGGAIGPFHSPIDAGECVIVYDEATKELGVLAGDAPVGLARDVVLPTERGKPTKCVLNWLSGERISQHRLALFLDVHPVHGAYVQVRPDRVSVGSKFDSLRAAISQ